MSLLHPRILSQGIFVTTLTETKINKFIFVSVQLVPQAFQDPEAKRC